MGSGPVSGGRQPVELDREEEDEDEREPVLDDGHAGEREHVDEPVSEGARANGGPDPEGRAMSTERAMVTPVRRKVAGSRSRAIGSVSRDSGMPPWARGLLIP